MHAFAFSNSPYPVRSDLPEAFREAWRQLAKAGTWWYAGERVAIAAETRAARHCAFCAERKQALSPFAPIAGDHTRVTELDDKIVDIVHRLTTDPSRLTRDWLEAQFDEQFTTGHYVEAISVVVTTLCIDSFHDALGFELEPLPEPEPGEPSRHTPSGLEHETAWVPLIGELGSQEYDLWPKDMTANVLRALSLVPDAVRLLKILSSAQYIPFEDVRNPAADGGRAISRGQIEFIAARVSAINDCFY